LLKIDIDGADVDIVSAIFDGTDSNQSITFPIFFEYDGSGDAAFIRKNFVRLLALFRKAAQAGYTAAFLWDDPGRFFGMVELGDETAIVNMTNYMAHFKHRSVWNYDICFVHQADPHFAFELCRLISAEAVIPLKIEWSV